MHFVRIVALVAFSGWATVASGRQESPRLSLTSIKPFDTVRDCVASKFEKEHYPLAFMPKSDGGTFSYRVRGKMFWYVTLKTTGTETKIILYRAKDRELTDRLSSCV